MKEKVTINDQIANTLFIPLYMRFKESRRPNGIMNDHLACELINRIDYDFHNSTKLHSANWAVWYAAVTSIGKYRNSSYGNLPR